MSVRNSFVKQFGEEEAKNIEAAAHEHKNSATENAGSDPFKWALLLCIGYQCFEIDGFREHHGIKAGFADIKRWIIEHGELGSHDGDCDYLTLMLGKYNDFMPVKTPAPREDEG